MKNITTTSDSGKVFSGMISEPIINKQKIVIHVHGLSGSYTEHNFYHEMHNGYPKQNIAFLVVEHSGTGPKSASIERFEQCVEDIQMWVNFATSLGYREIWLQSHSLGTSKVAYYFAKVKPKNISGLIFISPSEMHGLVHDPIGQIDFDSMYPEAKKLMTENKPNQILKHKLWESVDLSAGTFLNFFEDGANTAIFNYANPELGWDIVNSISIPVLAITGTKDDGIVTVMEAYSAMAMLRSELISSPKVKTIVYEGAEHDFVGFEKDIIKDAIEFINN